MEITENIGEYLEVLWILEESGVKIAKINEVAENLNITPPSAVQMLKKMEDKKLVKYESRIGVSMTKKGREIARQIIRNHRLGELLLTKILKMDIDEKAICGFEHHISKEIADAVCTVLDHPERCPHGRKIPRGNCCLY